MFFARPASETEKMKKENLLDGSGGDRTVVAVAGPAHRRGGRLRAHARADEALAAPDFPRRADRGAL